MRVTYSWSGVKFTGSIISQKRMRGFVGAFVRNRKVFANRKMRGTYLDIGCGPNMREDICNLDYEWRPGLDVCWDVTKGIPFKDDYVGGIFTEHMLEHIPFADGLELLAECRRVLQPGGLRVIVPDAQLYMTEYSKSVLGNEPEFPNTDEIKDEYPFLTPAINVNHIFRAYAHRFMWDYQTLSEGLRLAGFETVRRCAFGEGADPKLLRDMADRRAESLYVEAS